MELISRIDERVERGARRIVLRDPERQNALGTGLLRELSEALDRASRDPSCRAIVLQSSSNTFCSGLDLEEAFATDPPSMEIFQMFADCLLRLCAMRCPVVAVVEGRASGGGVGLAAAADIVIASESAEMILPEVIVGMIPAIIAPILLRRVSPGRLRALSLGTRAIGAEEAYSSGLVDEIAKPDKIAFAVGRQIGRLTRSSPDALARTKAYLDWLGDIPLRTSMDRAQSELGAWLRQAHIVEGARAFADGLAPSWFTPEEKPCTS